MEDNPVELQKACDLVAARGMMPLPCATHKDAIESILSYQPKGLVGILTDLHFPIAEGKNPEGACGLHVVHLALTMGMPVAICSDIDHHYATWANDLVRDVEKATGRKVAGFIQDSKNWEKALALLLDEKEER